MSAMSRRAWIGSIAFALRPIVVRLGLGLALLFMIGCARTANDASARHVILVTIDTLRADHLSCYGYARPTSDALHARERGSIPGFTIDELAREGVRFENAYSPRGETFPAIATLFTGKPPIETCALANGNILPRGASTLAERLHAKGFKTAAFTSNKLLVPGSGIEQGFDQFFSDASEKKDERAVDAACHWLGTQDLEHGPPLFVWLHLTGPHLPYDAARIGPVDFERLFADASYRGDANGSREFVDKAYTRGRELDAADVAELVALYDGEIARVDHLASRFFAFCAGRDASQPVDVLARSLVVITADHGEELYEHNRYFGHSKSVYEDVLHVPLIVRDPRFASGRVVKAMVGLEDVFATIVEDRSLTRSPPVHGRSFASWLTSGEGERDAPQFSLWRDRIFSVRSGSWRCVWNPDRIEPKETPPGPYPVPEIALYDVARDPHELHDVAAEHADVVQSLEAGVRAWLGGLKPCSTPTQGITPERLKALKDMGYAGEQEEAPPK
jgi:arylsulfatase A-like enzyme